MGKLKLGVIGMSEGNGHPYSWSAIFNGFNIEFMKDCPFSSIPDYLLEQNFPNDFLTQDAEVTHIYTQDSSTSEHTAKSSLIKNSVQNPKEMIGKIDALLLARDDAENHMKYAKDFLEAGIPIYIDKPLAHRLTDANQLFALQQFETQIYSCSALRYAKEFHLTDIERKKIGKIIMIQAYTPKSWEKYAVHVIEPVLGLLSFPSLSDFSLIKIDNYRRLSCIATQKNSDKTIVTISNLLNAPHNLSIEVIGEKASKTLVFEDSFTAFRTALQQFILQVQTKKLSIPREETQKVISLIEQGLN
ncbi:putative dehydrogenase [Bernardetia litoralis DSM 6794]|uniref:Putative dehydrogenase n=1 Tax=Bernardetia litoralis (strain ATCC 23117 / DSM 6794 / NBRC 15988 / NCIMB 1366 / Fx l1 / Sio-4) TaxID=880071 RepID=I4APH2_BERLS|nr:Gfo/Idh/MocA family oxidoreductase [Bernardetia litoralis]AFM05857.1 putative dehydrogenase [Bernardetia litoralis DSM 6794]